MPPRRSTCSPVTGHSPAYLGYGVTSKDLSKLLPMHEVLHQLRWEGLTGVHLMRTFLSRRIQPL
jgi:hypothetical protein